ncbi:unnamed protein product [Arctogadus glacialis]
MHSRDHRTLFVFFFEKQKTNQNQKTQKSINRRVDMPVKTSEKTYKHELTDGDVRRTSYKTETKVKQHSSTLPPKNTNP